MIEYTVGAYSRNTNSWSVQPVRMYKTENGSRYNVLVVLPSIEMPVRAQDSPNTSNDLDWMADTSLLVIGMLHIHETDRY